MFEPRKTTGVSTAVRPQRGPVDTTTSSEELRKTSPAAAALNRARALILAVL
jgi:hypothetical protein